MRVRIMRMFFCILFGYVDVDVDADVVGRGDANFYGTFAQVRRCQTEVLMSDLQLIWPPLTHALACQRQQ